jgi:hypothetical protein
MQVELLFLFKLFSDYETNFFSEPNGFYAG